MKAATICVSMGLGLILFYNIITVPTMTTADNHKGTDPAAVPVAKSSLDDFYEHVKNRFTSLFEKPNVRAILD
jgi:hypothetical protein